MVFPFKLTLSPTGKIKFRTHESSSSEEFHKQFHDKLPEGSAIYSFTAHSNPEDTHGTVLGEMIVVDKCTTSKFGEERLFFRHQRVEEDVKLKPEWKDDYLSEDCNAISIIGVLQMRN